MMEGGGAAAEAGRSGWDGVARSAVLSPDRAHLWLVSLPWRLVASLNGFVTLERREEDTGRG